MLKDYFSKRHISIILVVAMVLNIANFSFALDSETISDICIEQTSSKEYVVIDEDAPSVHRSMVNAADPF